MKARTKKPSLSVWDTTPLMYSDWIQLAGEHSNQNLVWRDHERFARDRYRNELPELVDHGGES